MRNPFIAMALAAAASVQMFRNMKIMAFNNGEYADPQRPTSYARNTGLTVAQSKRAAIKAKNRAKHRRACKT